MPASACSAAVSRRWMWSYVTGMDKVELADYCNWLLMLRVTVPPWSETVTQMKLHWWLQTNINNNINNEHLITHTWLRYTRYTCIPG